MGYHWYFAAGHYLKRHPGRDPTDWEQLIEGVAKTLAEHLGTTKPADETASSAAWAELRAYISQSLSIGPTTIEETSDQFLFVAELRCPICSLETMLRQLLMNRSNVSGGRFEGREIRYLYFYPTYFFTTETWRSFAPFTIDCNGWGSPNYAANLWATMRRAGRHCILIGIPCNG